MRVLTLTLLALLAFAPLAAAQEKTNESEESPSRPDDAAWTEDCPPDMMCAYDDGGEPGQALGPEDCIECSQPPQDDGNVSRGPDDGSCEFCRGEDQPVSDTCMDGSADQNVCDPDVQYLDGGSGGRGDAGSNGESGGEKTVPGASFAILVAAFAIAIFLLVRRS